MKWRLVQFSEVVVGHAHNPTILNPDFLASQRIVPKSWGWEVAETITTPPLAIVRYANGVNITVEQNKIQITDPNVEDGPGKSKISDIAAAYIEILPHVRYTAVGNNFQCLIPQNSPGEYLKSRFLKEGAWSNAPSQLDAIGLRLSYPLVPSGQLILTVDAAEAKLPDNADHQEVILCNANFSRECGEHPASEVAVDHLRKSMEDWNSYKQALATLFNLEAGSKI
ncbi:MAG: hypothetical protein ACYC3X_01155 [Pirellulaceae bacterium]